MWYFIAASRQKLAMLHSLLGLLKMKHTYTCQVDRVTCQAVNKIKPAYYILHRLLIVLTQCVLYSCYNYLQQF